MSSAKFFRFWFPAIFYSGIISYVSSLSNIQTPLPGRHFDKVCHVAEYLILGVLTARAFINAGPAWPKRGLYFFSLLVCILYGISDEFHQVYVSNRSADVADMIADAVGSLIGVYAYNLVLTMIERKSKT